MDVVWHESTRTENMFDDGVSAVFDLESVSVVEKG